MGTPYLGEIRLFAGTKAPTDWAICDGAVIKITDNQELYSLIATTWGGDGQTTFALPDLRGRVPLGVGKAPKPMTPRVLGEIGGQEEVALTLQQNPPHSHRFNVGTDAATTSTLSGNVVYGSTPTTPAGNPMGYVVGTAAPSVTADLAQGVVDSQGTGDEHSNMMPTLAINFIICTAGIYPN